jgi:DNA-binding Xre family transcriptional regulator
MPINWNLKDWLRDARNVSSASEAKRIVWERTGYVLSTQAVCDLMHRDPKMIRLETVQAFCDAFYCQLSDFCEVRPIAVKRRPPKPSPSSNSKDEDEDGPNELAAPDPSSNDNGTIGAVRIDLAALFPKAGAFSVSAESDMSEEVGEMACR